MSDIAKQIHNDMLVHANGEGADTLIGKVVGIKKHRFIKLSKHTTGDGKRHYIPLEWVTTITGNAVYLNKNALSVRLEWLDKAAVKQQLHGPQMSIAPLNQ
jgi:hypothetical protein